MLRRVVIRCLVLVALWVGSTESAWGQYTIRPRQKEQTEQRTPDPYEAFGGFVKEQIRNDYFDIAAHRAEKRRLRKERNTFEFESTFQTSTLQFENWTAGGSNTFSGLSTVYARHQFKLNKFTSDLTINARYGINYIDKTPFKNVDELKIKELMSWTIRNNWSYSATLNFTTQLTDGFASRTDNTLVSAILAPGYIDVSVGFTYAPSGAPYKLTLSPLSGNMITMADKRLYEQGLNGVPAGEKVYSKIGPSINASFDKHFFKNRLRCRSTLYAFTDLASPPTVRWDNYIDISLAKWLSINLYGVIYYLHNASPQAQYQYSATLGLSYKFKNK